MTEYSEILVESYIPEDRSKGLHGLVHIRPCEGQDPFLQGMHVACSKDLSNTTIYEVGTKFKIKAKLASRKGEGLYVYSSYKWSYTVI